MEKKQIQMIATAINTHIATLNRAINTEKDPEVKQIREKTRAEFSNLANDITTKDFFNETPIGKQKQ